MKFLNHLLCCGLAAICLASSNVAAAPINIEARDAIDLSGQWKYIVDPQKIGITRADSRRYAVFEDVDEPESREDFLEYNFNAAPRMTVPGDWNGQDAALTWYDGLVWFRRVLELEEIPDGRQLLHFGAANYKALVYVNGDKVGEHEGGFTPFAFDVTEQLHGGRNVIVVGVDSEHDLQSVPSPVVDWKNYGGLTRPVHLVRVPDTYISHYFIRLGSADRLQASVSLDGADTARRDVTVRIPALGVALSGSTDSSGTVTLNIAVPQVLDLWSPEDPTLYDVVVATEDDEVTDRIGFRTLEARDGDILLNGKPIFLRGICLHEEAIGAIPSRAINEARARELLSLAKYDLNANFVRLAHYPHSDAVTRVADELGLIIWSEIPVYWDIDFANADTLALAKQMQRDNIVRDRNRASIAFWSVANETPKTEERLEFLGELIDDARRLDDTRLMTAALHQVRSEGRTYIVDDPLGKLIDVVAVNTYQGWYGGMSLENVPSVRWQNPTGKPFIFSEFGAGALFGFNDPELEKFSEDFQAEYYRVTLEMARQVEGLSGMSPWILKDFQSPRRMHGEYQDYWNRKGLVSPEGHKKAAFFVLADWYGQLDSAGAKR